MKNTKQQTLVDQAKAIKPSSARQSILAVDATDRMDLAIAYMRGEIGLMQIGKAVWPDGKQNTASTAAYSLICKGIKEAYSAGKIKT